MILRRILSKDFKPHYLPDLANLENVVDKAKQIVCNPEN